MLAKNRYLGFEGNKKVKALLWFVAGSLFIVPSALQDGQGPSLGIGIMFIVFGIVSWNKAGKERSDTES